MKRKPPRIARSTKLVPRRKAAASVAAVDKQDKKRRTSRSPTKRAATTKCRSKWEVLLEQQMAAFPIEIPKPIPEYRFHDTRKWRFDFVIFTRQGGLIAVEVEGGVWSGGRHTTGAGFTADCEKYCEAAVLGWRVLRVTSEMVKSGAALEYIRRAMKW